MKKKVTMLAIGAMLAVALVGGGVYAYFSDIESSEDNQFSAGTMDLELNDAIAKTIGVAAVKPGDSGHDNFKLENIGTVNGNLNYGIRNITEGAGTTPEPEPTPDSGELAEAMHIVIWIDADGDTIQDASEMELYNGFLNSAPSTSAVSALAAGGETYVGFAWDIPATVGNEIQGDTVTFDIVFILNQA